MRVEIMKVIRKPSDQPEKREMTKSQNVNVQ